MRNTDMKHMTAWGDESTGITKRKTEDNSDLNRRQERHINRYMDGPKTRIKLN